MGSIIEDALITIGSAILGKEKINEIVIARLVTRGRNRPHPWSTRCDHICWSGLTDKTFNARLLPAKHFVGAEGPGTSRPPIPDVARLFAAAPSGQRPCPKSTCLFPAFAQYLTDGFIRTQMSNDPPFQSFPEDRRRTTSNHEIDLSPLYGRNKAQTDRLREDGGAGGPKGRLKSQMIDGSEFPPFLFVAPGQLNPDFCDAGTLVLDYPLALKNASPTAQATLFATGGDRVNSAPQVAMINVLLLREHNRLAAMLEANHPTWDDDAVFQTARNILIVMFIKIVIEEYINHINTTKFKIMANPKLVWGANWNRPNWMTVEFSLLYRWHSLVPQSIRWGGQDVPLTGLLLDNSRLIGEGLATAFADVSANNATELGLGNSASIFVGKPTEAEPRAVQQGRTNNVDSYNAYRKAMKLDPATSFQDVVGKSKDPIESARRDALAAQLQALYGNVDNLEFYVGLFAEPREGNGPLPPLITAMVAMDAFSQAFTNPLLSAHVWGDDTNRRATFTDAGLAEIDRTASLADMLARNTANLQNRFVGMTRPDWRRT
jgi:prostaglandin-endoperoxide synthase 2